MKVVIIEDEKPAAEKLHKALLQYDADINVLATLGSVQEATQWFMQNPMPELIFMDI